MTLTLYSCLTLEMLSILRGKKLEEEREICREKGDGLFLTRLRVTDAQVHLRYVRFAVKGGGSVHSLTMEKSCFELSNQIKIE